MMCKCVTDVHKCLFNFLFFAFTVFFGIQLFPLCKVCTVQIFKWILISIMSAEVLSRNVLVWNARVVGMLVSSERHDCTKAASNILWLLQWRCLSVINLWLDVKSTSVMHSCVATFGIHFCILYRNCVLTVNTYLMYICFCELSNFHNKNCLWTGATSSWESWYEVLVLSEVQTPSLHTNAIFGKCGSLCTWCSLYAAVGVRM